jgi:hypothetical protein
LYGSFSPGTIWGSHGGDYEDGCLLGCSAVWTGVSLPTFQRSVLPPSSGRWVITSEISETSVNSYRSIRTLQTRRQPYSCFSCLRYVLASNKLKERGEPSVWLSFCFVLLSRYDIYTRNHITKGSTRETCETFSFLVHSGLGIISVRQTYVKWTQMLLSKFTFAVFNIFSSSLSHFSNSSAIKECNYFLCNLSVNLTKEESGKLIPTYFEPSVNIMPSLIYAIYDYSNRC